MEVGSLIKIGRNKICPCGSGQKYKRCCLSRGKLRLSSYDITTEPVEEINTERVVLSKVDYQKFMILGEMLLNDEVISYKEAVSFLETLRNKYPPQRRVLNQLAVCYEKMGDKDKVEVEALIELTYRTFPDYLFGRTGYVSYWMQKGDYSKFLEVFGECYDLKSLYPERSVFHITEVFSFFLVCGRYFGYIGNKKIAEKYLNMASELKTEDPLLEIIENDILLGEMKKYTKELFTESNNNIEIG
jgi:tetratricopeptide (TPR) repeat protein